MGLIEPFNQSKEWTVTRILGLGHTAWLSLIAAPRHKLSLSVSRQLFQTGWRRRDSSLGEVARQINSKYKYLVSIVKQQCIARIQYIHIENCQIIYNSCGPFKRYMNTYWSNHLSAIISRQTYARYKRTM